MSQPYPSPVEVPTKLRCQFSLPGKKYDCRRIGKYHLNGKRYCASHYDMVWKVANPIYGQQHDWRIHVNKFTGIQLAGVAGIFNCIANRLNPPS